MNQQYLMGSRDKLHKNKPLDNYQREKTNFSVLYYCGKCTNGKSKIKSFYYIYRKADAILTRGCRAMRNVLLLLISSMFFSRPALAQTSAWGKGKFSEEEFISFRNGIMTSDIDDEATFGTGRILNKENLKTVSIFSGKIFQTKN